MKKFLVLAAIAATTSAHADWSPRVTSRIYTVTVQVNGGSLSYNEVRSNNAPLTTIANRVASMPGQLQQGFNGFLSQQVTSKGGRFLGGSVSGTINVAIRPDASGALFLTLSGISYQAQTGYSGKKWGIVSYDCVNTLGLNNIAVTAQYGALDGAIQNDKLGLSADPTSSTDCDSNLSWVLPIATDYIIGKFTDKVDAALVNSIKSSIGSVQDNLFYGRDQNYLVGLNKLVPADKVVALPGGGTFPIGQYVQSNLAYLLSNSQMDIQTNVGAVVKPVYGNGEPWNDSFKGDVLNISVAAPAISFSVKLIETAQVEWVWKCSIRDPSKVCNIP